MFLLSPLNPCGLHCGPISAYIRDCVSVHCVLHASPNNRTPHGGAPLFLEATAVWNDACLRDRSEKTSPATGNTLWPFLEYIGWTVAKTTAIRKDLVTKQRAVMSPWQPRSGRRLWVYLILKKTDTTYLLLYKVFGGTVVIYDMFALRTLAVTNSTVCCVLIGFWTSAGKLYSR